MHDCAACKIITYGPGAASVMRISNCIITVGIRSTCVRHLGGLFWRRIIPTKNSYLAVAVLLHVAWSYRVYPGASEKALKKLRGSTEKPRLKLLITYRLSGIHVPCCTW